MKLPSSRHSPTGWVQDAPLQGGQRIRLLSYNIQTGITTRRFSNYLTHSWKHVLPHGERVENLNRIAHLIHQHDVVGLQEVDGGSLRSGFINQTEYLAVRAGFPYWYDQNNRNLGKIAQHSIGLLSRFTAREIREHRLPGIIPGRGALTVEYQTGGEPLMLVIMHLALGRRVRQRQFQFIRDLVQDYRDVVVMGDMNCEPHSQEMRWLMENSQLTEPVDQIHTFPSWRPARNIDHILVSRSLVVEELSVLNYPVSDHLPVSMTLRLPE
jgi:endonuclease/exonuclease/phosphatase family metal-dependent hydrolase